MNFDLKTYLKEKQKVVNKHLDNILLQFNNQNQLIQAMEHSLMARGKRLRPILSMAAALACKKEYSPALPAACAIEMIHTYSLIHDDLPAMDDDDLRRGLPTCHNMFGESTAILAGDALLTHAFNVLAEPEIVFNKYPDIQTRLNLIANISKAAGIKGLVQGQILDMQAEQNYNLSEHSKLKNLETIHALKTGKMIIVSVESGALSVGADHKLIEKLNIYAKKIGLAFQVADDILNIEGDPMRMGKAAGSDIINDKMTFPGIIGLDASKKYAKKLISEAKYAIAQFDESAAPLRAIAGYIINRDH